MDVEVDNVGPEIVEDEIEAAISPLEDKKADGIDEIPAELLKKLEASAKKELIRICQDMYEKGEWSRDFTKAIISKLEETDGNIGEDWKDRRLIKNLYLNQEAIVRVADGMSEPAVIGRGVRQGCLLSPLLFSIYVEMMMIEAMEDVSAGIKVGDKKICKLIEQVLKERAYLESDHQLYRVCLMYNNQIIDDNTYNQRFVETFLECLTEQTILYMIIFPSKLPKVNDELQSKLISKAFIPILDEYYINDKLDNDKTDSTQNLFIHFKPKFTDRGISALFKESSSKLETKAYNNEGKNVIIIQFQHNNLKN
ncbi:unnamed protein product [Didymodactylos carnosus]|nr:unnamed protein product [Didymodactylos carnosus]CAF4364503.1 unnamed protein product [Didymodactylos carnosus]